MGRAALLLVLVTIVGLYIGPSLSYVSAWRESKARQGDVARLKHERARLQARRDQLRKPRIVEEEARGLGMVKPGERAYVLSNLPEEP